MNKFIITLALGFAVSLAGTVHAVNSGPATYAGPAISKIDFNNAVRSMNEADHICRATTCGRVKGELAQAPAMKKEAVQSADSPCHSTYCGKR
jgi:hypothetical protein